jgi:hypothetical protein
MGSRAQKLLALHHKVQQLAECWQNTRVKPWMTATAIYGMHQARHGTAIYMPRIRQIGNKPSLFRTAVLLAEEVWYSYWSATKTGDSSVTSYPSLSVIIPDPHLSLALDKIALDDVPVLSRQQGRRRE